MNYLALLATMLLSFLATPPVTAQGTNGSESLQAFADRLSAFGKTIPQEKVFVHMDNTCYFMGDTIWFSVYSRQTDSDRPSSVSRVLYAELLDNDGFLVKRKLIEMKEGRGNGWFELVDSTMFSGFYELRVYTRWQLNWGEFQHEHKKILEGWFYNKACAREYFRDYEKLYSRVFPVYNKPEAPGEYTRDMTLRLLARYYSSDPDDPTTPTLSLFPEGGNLVAGCECRVAFEACMSDGEALEGTLLVDGQQVRTIHRGRGVFTLTPQPGENYTCTFTSDSGKTAESKLGPADDSGASLRVEQNDSIWRIRVTGHGSASMVPLGMTVMHEGRMEAFHTLDDLPGHTLEIPDTLLAPGVHQVTVFDADGHVYADRLFFSTGRGLCSPTLSIQGVRDEYEAESRIELTVSGNPSVKGSLAGQSISLSVADAYNQIATYDSGNIFTEMLLGSEVRGFIPNPEWYFEKDGDDRREGLDLLMMTQGWRRFRWRDIAVPGEWEIIHPAEHAQIITGAVHRYDVLQPFMSPEMRGMITNMSHMGDEFLTRDERYGHVGRLSNYRRYTRAYTKGASDNNLKKKKRNARADSLGVRNEELRERMTEDGGEAEARGHGPRGVHPA